LHSVIDWCDMRPNGNLDNKHPVCLECTKKASSQTFSFNADRWYLFIELQQTCLTHVCFAYSLINGALISQFFSSRPFMTTDACSCAPALHFLCFWHALQACQTHGCPACSSVGGVCFQDSCHCKLGWQVWLVSTLSKRVGYACYVRLYHRKRSLQHACHSALSLQWQCQTCSHSFLHSFLSPTWQGKACDQSLMGIQQLVAADSEQNFVEGTWYETLEVRHGKIACNYHRAGLTSLSSYTLYVAVVYIVCKGFLLWNLVALCFIRI